MKFPHTTHTSKGPVQWVAKGDPIVEQPAPHVIIDRQAARIRELEGALRELLTVVHDEADDIDEDGGVCVYAFAADIEAARRILAKGGAS